MSTSKFNTASVFSLRISKSDEECLKEIFKRIGQKETTKQGLQDLYNFKQRNPHADRQLEPFLVRPQVHPIFLFSFTYFREISPLHFYLKLITVEDKELSQTRRFRLNSLLCFVFKLYVEEIM